MKAKRIATSVLSAALALGTFHTLSWASSTSTSTSKSTSTTTVAPKPGTYKLQTKAIYLNGKLLSKPVGFVANQTTYFPIWYVMQALDTMKMTNHWNGSTWVVKTSAGQAVDLTKITVGTGTISLMINNTTVHKVNGIQYIDPSSGQLTTFIPIWYIMQLLDRLHIDASSWDGTNWKMKTVSSGGSSSGSGGTGGTSGGTGSGSGSTGSGGTTPPPVVDPSPLASTIPGAVSKGQLVMDMGSALKLKPSSLPSQSPFDDVPATDPSYGPIEAAIQANIVAPFAATHFGSGDVVTLSDAEKLYWTYLGISYASYQPGGSMSAWASFIGLTQGLSNSSQYLTVSDEQLLMKNLEGLLAGEVLNGITEQLRYTPQDEYQWTFYGNTYYNSSSAIQQAVTKTYQFFNAITMQVVGDSMQVTIPVDGDKEWFAYARSQDNLEYSTDGGATWVSADVFDGSTVQTPMSTVILKAPLANGMSITYNNMVSSAAGSVSLGWVNLSDNGQGGIAAQRVTLN